MKKFLGITLIVLIVLWLTSCGGVTTSKKIKTDDTTNVEKSERIMIEHVETEKIITENILTEEIIH